MKHRITLLMALVGAIFFSQSVWAQDYDGSVTLDDGITIYYNFQGDRITICAPANETWVGFNMPVGDLVIPASITHQGVSYPVTEIEPKAFEKCIDITSVIIPNSVNYIAYNAFFECFGITSLTIGSSVIDISNGAFAFCSALEEIHFRSANPPTLNGTAFFELDDVPVYVPCGSLLSYSGWGGFTDIRGESEKVKIGSLWYLLDCDNHTATVVPELSVPQQITSPLYSNHSCPSGDITIPASVEYGNQTFAVTAIGDGAFAYCQNISSIVIPESVTSIGNSAFLSCDVMASLTIGNSVTSIGNKAFARCLSLESVTIPNLVISIGNNAFEHCYSLTSVTIGNSVTSIGNEAFISCIGLTSLTIGNSVTSIGIESFFGCNNLTSVTIPNSVTSVGNGAFRGCNSMTSLTIGNSVTSIGNEAFAGCNHLTEIHSLASNPPTLGSNVFIGVPHNIPLYVPCDTVSDYHSASVWSSFNNIQNEDDCFTVTVSANDPEMGTTEGGNGYYLYWAEPTLTATPKCGYRFVHWINVAGDEVSTDAEFTIVVTRDTSLTAVFKPTDTVLVNGLWYRLNPSNHTATVVPETKNNPYYVNSPKPTGELFIPSLVSYCGNDYTVTKIGANAFFNCTGLTGNVTIPNTVTSISEYAFFYCTDITSLTIGSAVSSIDVLAFRFCTRLQSIVVESATPPTLGANAFANCPTGIPVTVPCNSLAAYQTANRWSSFTHIQEASTCTHTVTVTVDDPSMGTVSGDGTYTVGATATLTATPNCGYRFVQWTSNSTPVSTDNPVSFIVTKDTALTAVFEEAAKVMIDGLWYSLDCEFGYATVVPENNTEPYYSTAPAGDIVIPANIEYGGSTYKVRHIGEYAFYGCSDITSVTLPNRFDHIASYAFYGCSGLTSINLPNSIYGIGIYAFYGCSGLTSLSIPSSVTRIDSETFKNCTGLSSINIPYGVTYIAVASFEGCTSLTSVNIPNSVTTLYGFSFSGCTGLTSVTLGSAINRIGVGAFSGCRNLTSIIIPNGVTSIEQTTFSSCINLTSVTLGSGITSINEGAFRNCTSLTSITLPDGVTSIGPSAFEDCTNLITINIPDAVTSISQSAFDGCSSLASITIPDGVTTLYNYTFSGCSSMTSVTIGSGVTTIGGYVFWQCGSLEEIHSFASLPPSLGDGVFGYVSRSIPVNVPCGKVSAYQNASGWGEFTSIREMDGCTHTVTATSADEAMGSVTGGGSYPHGGEATLTATANEGYHFVQWNDGSDVNPRSLTVTQDTTFTASFAPTTVYTTVDSNVCDNKFPITWNGVTFSDAGTETATLQNHLGADSIVTMNVHLKHTSTGDTTAVEFDQFTWYGHTYYQSTSTPTHLLTNAAGCDSTVTLHLTINPSHVGEFEITATADDAARGTVSGGGRYDAGDEVTLKASASCGYQFLQWSDGITDNPRTISVAGNASYTAQFQQANYIFQTPSGQMLNYAVDCETQTACVTGYTGVCRGLLVIPPLIRIKGVIYVVVSIGPSAFENNTGLLRVMIPGTVDAIYQSAFKGCTNLAKVEGWYQLKGLE